MLKGVSMSAKVLEKAYRISNLSSLILTHILEEDGGYYWMTDRDSINQHGNWEFTVHLHDLMVREYCSHLKCIKKGYSTPFGTKDEFSNDFLSLSDLISGALDDYCNRITQGDNPQQLLANMKPKSIEILKMVNNTPSYMYLVEDTGTGVSCKNIQVIVNE